MTTVDGFKLLADAQDYLLAVVRGVPADAWGAPTPCAEWTAGQVYHHARLDQRALTMQITGSPPPGDPFSPEGTVPADPAAELEQVCAAALAAWESGRDAESVLTPMGPMPAAQGASVAALDAALHAWDIAVATGQDLPLADALAEGLEGTGAFLIPFVRDNFGKFDAAVPLPAGSGPAARLLAFSGRDPRRAPRTA
jgi:uncharacterized protein (TIGR03086 family)